VDPCQVDVLAVLGLDAFVVELSATNQVDVVDLDLIGMVRVVKRLSQDQGGVERGGQSHMRVRIFGLAAIGGGLKFDVELVFVTPSRAIIIN